MIITKSILINSTIEKVWKTFVDPVCWPDWNTVMKDVSADGHSFANGSYLRCKFRPFFFPIKMIIKIEQTIPCTSITWSSKKCGLSARHEFFFQAGGNGVLVTSEEAFSGLLAAGSGFLLPLQRMRDLTEIFLEDLKKACEK